ncbi:DUF7670 domain-containing protein [Kosmotoga pacifica]|uniref:DUF7670 domain-containing protein n=1 Tax=Kosmotoga pacifica TaxID=1330330 RepID=A0A0G2ZBV8_9BACT|nr:hypothetical protein [Kosmotoga pacifica]AKI97561.1 hypothetical protein IX53_06735 [Kosmotoga pacifica]
MESNGELEQKKAKRLLLITRIWSTVVIAFGLFIFLGYAIQYLTTGVADPNLAENYPFIENIPPILIMVSIFGLILAWKWVFAGGLMAIVFSVANFVIFLIHWPLSENLNYLIAPYGINLLILIPGILYIIYWDRLRKQKV